MKLDNRVWHENRKCRQCKGEHLTNKQVLKCYMETDDKLIRLKEIEKNLKEFDETISINGILNDYGLRRLLRAIQY